MTKLYNANDGLTGRTGGPYLDIEQAKQAEVNRAIAEDREPDFETMGAGAGIQLVTASHLINTVSGVNNLPSQNDIETVDAETAVDGIVSGDNSSTLKPWSEVELPTAEDETEAVKEPKTTKSKSKSDDTATETK